MAVTPTGAIYKAFKFNGESSRNYGIYITGAAVYNAPERDVEMVSIPGRNGSFALDNGRFENIEVSYPAGVYADNETDFAQAISDFRNYLCSKKGYVRLEDDYNPDEFRMAIYKSGLEVTPAQLRAGEFEIVFECMPQRWLKSGEGIYDAPSSGATILNPTNFDAKPLLLLTGYGDSTIDGSIISIAHVPLGTVQLSDSIAEATTVLSSYKLANGDRIYKTTSNVPNARLYMKSSIADYSVEVTSTTNCTATVTKSNTREAVAKIIPAITDFYYGTSVSVTSTAAVKFTNGITGTMNITLTTSYDGDSTITMSVTYTSRPSSINVYLRAFSHPAYYGDSTKSVLPDPIYIDLDIGEAYGEVEGVMTSLDSMVSLPAELPVFKPGANTITYPNTVTAFRYTPRWWKI